MMAPPSTARVAGSSRHQSSGADAGASSPRTTISAVSAAAQPTLCGRFGHAERVPNRADQPGVRVRRRRGQFADGQQFRVGPSPRGRFYAATSPTTVNPPRSTFDDVQIPLGPPVRFR
jgi:hypothetical protein